ncbi:BolA family protein [Atopomonas hussainii]|uniref:BolA family protein n=1 Tax=Atopomonas hussainii TaxID=1429083 RepID=UPI0008FFEF83|nr:BolA family protein [Atopomonas hussainii]
MSKQALIEQALQALEPSVLQVEDESHMHSRGQETHYKAVVVSERFAGLNRVKRHQQVYAAMGELMPQVHALALHTYTAEEWQQQQSAPASPQCLGGSKHDH